MVELDRLVSSEVADALRRATSQYLELTLEVFLEHVLGIKTMTLVFNPVS